MTHADRMGELLLWSAALIVAVIVFALVAYRIKRRYLGALGTGTEPLLDLDRLQRMHDAGDLTAEEFKKLRDQTVKQLRASGPGG